MEIREKPFAALTSTIMFFFVFAFLWILYLIIQNLGYNEPPFLIFVGALSILAVVAYIHTLFYGDNRIIVSESELIFKNWRWPYTYPLTHTFLLTDIDRVVLTRTKYLSEFLSGNESFKKIAAISRDTFKEALFRKQKLFDRDLYIARTIQHSIFGEEAWLCIVGKNGNLYMTTVNTFKSSRQKYLDLISDLQSRGLNTECRL